MPRKIDIASTRLLQVPVRSAIACQIADYGGRIGKSQAQFAIICLEQAFEGRENFGDRLAVRLAGLIGSAIPATRRLKKRVREDSKVVRLQIPVPQAIVAKLEALGAEMNHSVVQAAGWLLERVILDEDWIVRAVLSPFALDLTRWVRNLGTETTEASHSPAPGLRGNREEGKRRVQGTLGA